MMRSQRQQYQYYHGGTRLPTSAQISGPEQMQTNPASSMSAGELPLHGHPQLSSPLRLPSPRPPNLSSALRPALRPSLGSTSSAGFHQPPQSTHRRPTAPITSTRGLAPVLGYSEDWLDQSVVNSSRPQTPNHFTASFWQYWGELGTESEEPEDTTDTDREPAENDPEASMPPHTQYRSPHARRARSQYVDLTGDNMPSTTATPTHADASRRRRRASGQDSGDDSDRDNKRHRPRSSDAARDALDLTDDAITAGEALLQRQQKDAIQSQHHEDTDSPLKIGRRTCIICMEPYTNATVTVCGHIFCHECLIQALMAGEKNTDRGVGNCPVCRKQLPRKSKSHNIIPISFMKRSAYKGKHRQERE